MGQAARLLPEVLALTLTIGLGAAVFFAAAACLGAFELQEVRRLMRRS